MSSKRSMLSKSNSRGFSLVELMVVIVIFSFVIIGVTSSTVLFGKLIRTISDQEEFDSAIAVGMTTIGNDVRMADSFSLPNSSNCRINRTDGYQVDYTLDKQPDNSLSLIRTDDDGTRTIARNVDFIVFKLSGTSNRYLDVHLNLKKEIVGGNNSERSLQLRFTRRNN